MLRLVLAHDVLRLRVPPGLVLVYVVAQVQDRVQVRAGGQVAVGGEVAGLPVGAGDHAEADPCGRRLVGRGGQGASGGGDGGAGGEPVPVRRLRLEPAHVHLDRVVGGGARGDGTGGDHVGEVLVGGHLPAHLGGRAETGTGHCLGVGVTRVHSRTPSGSGSPEATPCRKAGAVPAAWAAEAPSEVRGPARPWPPRRGRPYGDGGLPRPGKRGVDWSRTITLPTGTPLGTGVGTQRAGELWEFARPLKRYVRKALPGPSGISPAGPCRSLP